MRKFFTLVAFTAISFFAHSQVKQNFSSNPTTAPSCFAITGFTYQSNPGNISTSFVGANTATTQFVDLSSGTVIRAAFSVSGNFQGGNGSKYSKIEIGILDKSGNFTVLNNNGLGQAFTGASNGTVNGTIPTTGTYRVQVRVTTGNSSVITAIDDIETLLNGSYHYNSGNNCNEAPTSINDVFTAPTVTSTVTENVITNPNGTDSDPNGEAVSAVPQANVILPQGTLNLATNGTFLFVPNASFRGGSVSFSYTITDNGFPALTSTSTVTINYPSAPVATNDTYAAALLSTELTGNVLDNDTDPNTTAPFNANSITATLVSGPVDEGGKAAIGTFSFDANGNFSFKPTNGFAGGEITFTYKITDNTYSPYFSNTATVTLIYPEGAILPVNFVSFTAKAEGSTTKLTWNVAEQKDVLHYAIERSSNGNNFTKIGEVATSDVTTYNFIDKQPAQGTVFYRIKNVDVDGKFKYSTIVSIRNGQSAIVLKAFPLPAKNNITLQHATANAQSIIRLSAQDGRTMKTIRPAAGTMQTGIDISAFAPGLYLLSFDNGNGLVETLKLVKQ